MKYTEYMEKNIVVMVPYPAQGHITPMLHLAKAFINHGFKPMIIVPEFINFRVKNNDDDDNGDICYVIIPDGLQEGGGARDFFATEKAMENYMPSHLERVIRKLEVKGDGVVCMVVDLLASWAIRVGIGLGIRVAGFWPAMLATYRLIASIPRLIRAGVISDTGNPIIKGVTGILPSLPILNPAEDLPWLIGKSDQRASRFKFWKKTMERSKNLKWLLVNTFPEESHGQYRQQKEQILIDYCSQDYNIPNVVPIGPLNKQTLIKGPIISLWEEDKSCLDWLGKQRPCSVLYVSFGSWVSPIGEAKIRTLALALEALERPFIWVLNSSWRQGLPVGYLERISKNKKVVSWAPQMEILRHEAVGCYLTHCGWNSTMEAIQCKKPLLCYPIAGDQFVNCAYIVKVWQIGLRILGFGLKDVEQGLKSVVGNSKIKERLERLNERVMGEEASSRVNINLTNFVCDIERVSNSKIL